MKKKQNQNTQNPSPLCMFSGETHLNAQVQQNIVKHLEVLNFVKHAFLCPNQKRVKRQKEEQVSAKVKPRMNGKGQTISSTRDVPICIAIVVIMNESVVRLACKPISCSNKAIPFQWPVSTCHQTCISGRVLHALQITYARNDVASTRVASRAIIAPVRWVASSPHPGDEVLSLMINPSIPHNQRHRLQFQTPLLPWFCAEMILLMSCLLPLGLVCIYLSATWTMIVIGMSSRQGLNLLRTRLMALLFFLINWYDS